MAVANPARDRGEGDIADTSAERQVIFERPSTSDVLVNDCFFDGSFVAQKEGRAILENRARVEGIRGVPGNDIENNG